MKVEMNVNVEMQQEGGGVIDPATVLAMQQLIDQQARTIAELQHRLAVYEQTLDGTLLELAREVKR